MKTIERKIEIKGQEIPYLLKRKWGVKYIRLAVSRRGELIATLPLFSQTKSLENFIESKTNWILEKINQARKNPPGLLQRGNRKKYLRNKERAREIILKRLEYFNKFYRFQYKKVSIRNQHSRWGSCSSKKNLNFNWRIIYLPQKYLDYLVVHELCHLKELNHSAKFWKLVAKKIPDYLSVRKRMLKL